MRKTLKPEITKPQYVVCTDITYAQVDSWYDHCRRDLKLDLIYSEDDRKSMHRVDLWRGMASYGQIGTPCISEPVGAEGVRRCKCGVPDFQ